MKNRLAMAMAGALCCASSMATAQEAESAEQDTAQATTDLDRIMVTARKREEALHDVPIAISAFNDERREALVLDDMDDMLRQVPSTTLVTTGPEFMNDVSIRGQGSGRLGFSETSTGLYRDGMYNAGGGYGGRSLSRMDLFDSQYIEVMRGPQGALFGRNSVGGAINVGTKRSETEFGGHGTLRSMSEDRLDMEAVVNIPLTQTVGMRVGGFHSDQDEGNIYNQATGKYVDRQTYRGVRSVFDMTTESGLALGLLYEYYASEMPAFAAMGYVPNRVDGTVLDPDPYKRADMNREGRSDISDHFVLFNADYGFSGADLYFKLTRRERDGGRYNEDNDHYGGASGIDVTPGDATDGPDYTVAQHEDYERTGAQLYLASNGDGRVSWMVGAEGLWSESDMANDPDACPAYTGVAQASVPGCYVGLAGPLTTIAGLTQRIVGRVSVNHDEFLEKLSSYSLFGTTDIALTDRLKLGLEMRVQIDEKDFRFARWSEDPLVYFGTGALPPGLQTPYMVDPDGAAGPRTATPVQFCPPDLAADQCAPGLETARLDASRDWTFWLPAATLHYRAAEAQALYLRYAAGFRPGGFNTNQPVTTVREDLEPQLIYKPEKAYSLEMGWKGELLGGLIKGEAAVYYMQTKDVQVVTSPSIASRGFVLQNAGNAHVYGAELELRNTTRIGAGSLLTSLAVSTADGEFEHGATALLDIDGDGIPDSADLSGYQVPRLRDYQLTLNLGYTHPVGDNLRGLIGVSWQRAEGGYETPDNIAPYEPYSLVDLRLGLEGESWKVSLFGRNITDDRYRLNNVGVAQYWSLPRSWGAEVTLKF